MKHRCAANWKALPENDSDGYHLGFVHRALFSTVRSQYQRVVGDEKAAESFVFNLIGGSEPPLPPMAPPVRAEQDCAGKSPRSDGIGGEMLHWDAVAQNVPLSGREEARMPVTTALQTLTADEVLARLRALRTRQPVKFSAFYSSQLGGIVTDPALMVVPFDDHMVHRGHGIFDTAAIEAGKIYDLEAHLDRFVRSARTSKLQLPAREEMRDIIVRTTAASGRRDGSIRYWASAGPGSLGLTPAAGAEPGFFVMVFAGLAYPDTWYTQGLRVMTTTYPIKPPLYAVTKSTNYLPNALMQMEAQERGLDNGVFIDEAGNVGESSNMNVAFVGADGMLKHPKFDHILSGCTSLRLLELAASLQTRNLIKGVQVCDIPVAEARAAREMMLVGSSIKVAPVVEWDQRPIGDGKPGPVARALRELLQEDMRSARERLIDVPY